MLSYEVYTLQADDKHDYRGQRCINGAIGLRVPSPVIQTHCANICGRENLSIFPNESTTVPTVL